MTFVFTAACIVYIAVGVHINSRAVNVVSLLVLPYVLIVPLNNTFGVRQGFYAISDDVLMMLLLGISMFFVGSIVVDLNKRVAPAKTMVSRKEYDKKIGGYKVKAMLVYAAVVELIAFARLVLIILGNGVSYISSSDFEGMMVSGPAGHLLLTLYGVIPIIFYYWLGHKNRVPYLFATLCAVALFFTTMVKYHSIGLLIVLYLFVSFEDRRYFKKGAVILVCLAALLFISNYLISFYSAGTISKVSSSYYIEHLWAYIAGSLIYDNNIFDGGVRVGTSVFYKLGTFVCGFPNMFLNAFLGTKLFPHEQLEHLAVASNGQKGNVVDAIGYLYPSQGGAWDIASFIVVMLFLGSIMTMIYNQILTGKEDEFHVTMSVYLTFFIFFSFFGTFYINAVCWELLIYSAIFPRLFREKEPKASEARHSVSGLHARRAIV